MKLSQHKTSTSKDLICSRNKSFPSPGGPLSYLDETCASSWGNLEVSEVHFWPQATCSAALVMAIQTSLCPLSGTGTSWSAECSCLIACLSPTVQWRGMGEGKEKGSWIWVVGVCWKGRFCLHVLSALSCCVLGFVTCEQSLLSVPGNSVLFLLSGAPYQAQFLAACQRVCLLPLDLLNLFFSFVWQDVPWWHLTYPTGPPRGLNDFQNLSVDHCTELEAHGYLHNKGCNLVEATNPFLCPQHIQVGHSQIWQTGDSCVQDLPEAEPAAIRNEDSKQ